MLTILISFDTNPLQKYTKKCTCVQCTGRLGFVQQAEVEGKITNPLLGTTKPVEAIDTYESNSKNICKMKRKETFMLMQKCLKYIYGRTFQNIQGKYEIHPPQNYCTIISFFFAPKYLSF